MKTDNLNNFNLSFSKEELIDLIEALKTANAEWYHIVNAPEGSIEGISFGESIRNNTAELRNRTCVLLRGLKESLQEVK